MDKRSVVREVRELIGRADLGAALERLGAWLEAQGTEREAMQELLHISAKYEKARRDEAEDLVTHEQTRQSYNLANKHLLALLEDIEQGRKPSAASTAKPRKWLLPAVATAVLLSLGALLYVLVLKPAPPSEGIAEEACPVFSARSVFNVLVLPFLSLTQDKASIHVVVRDRLNEFSGKQRLLAEASIYKKDFEDESEYPSRYEEAETIGSGCNARLVIWGTYERRSNGTNEILTRYKFLNMGQFFAFRQLQLDQDSRLDTVTSLSNIATQGSITSNVEQIISQVLLGLVAHEAGDNRAALELLNSADVTDDTLSLLKQMVLADCYLATQDNEKARAAYDEALALHPQYGFALKNRAALAFDAGDYAQAEADLTQHLTEKPSDASALKARAQVYLKTDQMTRAKGDIEVLESQKEDKVYLDKLNTMYDNRIKTLRTLQAASAARLQQQPGDVAELERMAELSMSLGDLSVAASSAEAVVQQRPENVKAVAILIEARQLLRQPAAATKAIEKAERAGVTKEAIILERPALRRRLD